MSLSDELAASEKEFRLLAEAMPQIVWITRPDGWNIYFNQKWVEYTGLTLEESYGHGWNKPFHPDDQKRAWVAWQNAVNNNGIYSLECRLRRADGVYRWWLIRGVPAFDEHEKIYKWFGTCTDINDIKLAGSELRNSKYRYDLLATRIPVGIYLLRSMTDESFVLDYASPRMAEMLNLSVESLLENASAVFQVTHPDDRQGFIDFNLKCIQQRQPFDWTGRFVVAGTIKWLQFSSSPETQEDGTILWFGLVTDVTERKKFESALMQRERDLKEAQQLAMVGSWQWDTKTDVHTWSDEIYRIYGRDLALPPAVYPDVQQYFTPESWAKLSAAVEKASKDGLPYECDAEVVKPDGTHRWITARGEAKRDDMGNFIGLHGTVHDITVRKQGELALERANRALRTLSACNEALVRAGSEAELMDTICRLIVETGRYRMAWIGFPVHDKQKSVRPMAQYGHDDGYLSEVKRSWADDELGQGPTGKAIRTGTIQVNQNFLSNANVTPWRESALNWGYQSSIALPLRSSAGTTLGALTIYASVPDAFNEIEVNLLKELAEDTAFGIETMRTRAERDRNAFEHKHHEEILRHSLEQSIQAIADTVEARDPYTAGHERRVAELAVVMAQEMGLTEERIQGIRLAASIHDLGKIQVPAEILSKPGKLSDIEFKLIKEHPQAGYDILSIPSP